LLSKTLGLVRAQTGLSTRRFSLHLPSESFNLLRYFEELGRDVRVPGLGKQLPDDVVKIAPVSMAVEAR
jgi:hypothetical protein